jgi:hypothetical protein
MSEKHRTEQVYDDEINPLVAQIFAICERERIPLFLSAGMLDPAGDPLFCTTRLCHGAGDQDERLMGAENRFQLCHGIVLGHSGLDRAAAMRITRMHPDPVTGDTTPPLTITMTFVPS